MQHDSVHGVDGYPETLECQVPPEFVAHLKVSLARRTLIQAVLVWLMAFPLDTVTARAKWTLFGRQPNWLLVLTYVIYTWSQLFSRARKEE